MIKLNQNQKGFCESTAENIRLLAPAGSGKTLALLYRCLSLYEQDRKQRFQIFVFTNTAKDELENRLKEELAFNHLQNKVEVITLNKAGKRYIQNQEDMPDYQSINGKLHKTIKNVLRKLYKKGKKSKAFLGNMKDLKPKDFISISDTLKNTGFKHDWSKEKFEEHTDWVKENRLYPYFEKEVIGKLKSKKLNNPLPKSDSIVDTYWHFFELWKTAVAELIEMGMYSLNDQKYVSNHILQENLENLNKETLFRGNAIRHHILVDEFQDISPLDLELIKSFVKANQSTLTIVGDDDQAVYEWRGSTPKFILNPDKYFEKEFETHILGINYRSPKNIVIHAQNLIKNNKERENKDIVAYKQDKAKIYHINKETQNQMRDEVMSIIKKTNKKIAVISRKRSQLVPIQIQLASEDINFYTDEDLDIFETEEFTKLQEILRICQDSDKVKNREILIDDIVELFNVIEHDLMYEKTQKKLKQILNKAPFIKDNISLKEVYEEWKKDPHNCQCSDLGDDDNIKKRREYSTYRNLISSKTVSEALEVIQNKFKYFKKNFTIAPEDESIFHKDPPFIYLSEYAQKYEDDYQKFLEHLNKVKTKKDFYKDPSSNIHVMTALRTKGREYDIVIILDVIDDIWPIKYADTKELQEQERRLFYVAFTRTKEELWLMSTKEDKYIGKTEPSPYLDELGGNWKEDKEDKEDNDLSELVLD